MSPFWKPGLDALQQIAREPIAPAGELKLLQRQLATAIEMVERGDVVPNRSRSASTMPAVSVLVRLSSETL